MLFLMLLLNLLKLLFPDLEKGFYPTISMDSQHLHVINEWELQQIGHFGNIGPGLVFLDPEILECTCTYSPTHTKSAHKKCTNFLIWTCVFWGIDVPSRNLTPKHTSPKLASVCWDSALWVQSKNNNPSLVFPKCPKIVQSNLKLIWSRFEVLNDPRIFPI